MKKRSNVQTAEKDGKGNERVALTRLQEARLRELMAEFNVARAKSVAALAAENAAETAMWREVETMFGNLHKFGYTVKNMGLDRISLWRGPLRANFAK